MAVKDGRGVEQIMKVDERVSNYLAMLNSETVKPAVQAGDAGEVKSVAGAPPIAVDISSSAAQLAEDEARRAKLDIIRQQLAEGSYNISGKDVADKILKVLKG